MSIFTADDNYKETLSQAVTLIRQGQKDQARTILIALLKADPRNEIAWLWLVETLPKAEQRIAALEQCLKIIPESLAARKGLERLKAAAVAKPVAEASPPPAATRRVAPEVVIENGTARPDSNLADQTYPKPVPTPKGKNRHATRPHRSMSLVEIGFIVVLVIAILGVGGVIIWDRLIRPSLSPKTAPSHVGLTATPGSIPTQTAPIASDGSSTRPAVEAELSATFTATPTPTPSPTPTLIPQKLTKPGLIVYVGDQEGSPKIFRMNSDGSDQTRLTNGWETSPVWSPNGQQIAYMGLRDPLSNVIATKDEEIYLIDSDGSGRLQLTDNAFGDEDPAWSPDGQSIAFSSNRDGNWEIYLMNADGSDPRRLTNSPADEIQPSWSPTGMTLAYAVKSEGQRDIWVMNLDGSNVTRLTDTGADFSPAWSPDGKKIAFCSMRDSDPDNYADVELYLMNADGSGQKALTDTQAGETDPVWSPDGKGILISTGNGGNNSLVVIDPSSGQIIRQLPKGLGGMYQPDWQILRDEPSLASTAASPAGPSLLFFTGDKGCEIRQASGGQQNLIAIEAGKNGKKSV